MYKPDEELIPIGAAAEMLGVTVPTLRRWDRCGWLSPARTPGRHRRYSLAELKEVYRGMRHHPGSPPAPVPPSSQPSRDEN
jgi:excisionase family DNA binding protein